MHKTIWNERDVPAVPQDQSINGNHFNFEVLDLSYIWPRMERHHTRAYERERESKFVRFQQYLARNNNSLAAAQCMAIFSFLTQDEISTNAFEIELRYTRGSVVKGRKKKEANQEKAEPTPTPRRRLPHATARTRAQFPSTSGRS